MQQHRVRTQTHKNTASWSLTKEQGQFNKERLALRQNMSEQLDIHMQKTKLDTDKNEVKMDQRPKCKI